MPDPTPDQRLAALRRRWESERTPTASVSLAEEYRRQGRHSDARGVLEEALKAFPQHLSALVALGRVRLEAGDPAGAAQVLEKVLARDPMQLVANKMLAQAYLELGRPSDAEQRIRIYSLLNDRDPELVGLQRRLRQALAPAPPAAPLAAPTAVTAPDQPVESAAPEPASAPATPSPTPEPARPAGESAEELLFDLSPLEPAVLRAAPGTAPPAPPVRAGGEIFAGLAAAEVVAKYHEALAAGDVLALPAGRGSAPVATATLGELYLRQGHRAEAEDIFTAVLRAAPWNESARAGLVAARAGSPAAAAGEGGEPRAVRLRSYLERLRRARGTRPELDVR